MCDFKSPRIVKVNWTIIVFSNFQAGSNYLPIFATDCGSGLHHPLENSYILALSFFLQFGALDSVLGPSAFESNDSWLRLFDKIIFFLSLWLSVSQLFRFLEQPKVKCML